MKKILLVLGIVALVVVGGLVIFVATFNADRYRPLVVQKLHEATGRPVTLDRLALGWSQGVALQASGLAIYAEDQAHGEPLARVETISAVVQLWPLLSKDVQVSAVILDRPRIRVTRDAQGRIDLMGLAAVGSPAAASGQTAAVGGAPVAFRIDSVSIRNGSLQWIDAMTTPPTALSLDKVDVTLGNVSPSEPIEVRARLALLSQTQNVAIHGRVRLPRDGQLGTLEAFRLETDLGRLDSAALVRAVPSMASAGLRGWSGTLQVAVGRLVLDPQWLSALTANVKLVNGSVALDQLPSPIEAMALEAVATAGRLEVSNASANLAGGTIELTGTVDHLDTQPQLAFHATIQRLALDRLRSAVAASDPQLRGQLSASFAGTAAGAGWPMISRTLSGTGRVTLTDGRVANVNILRSVFEKLSIIPGVVRRLEAKLPASYQDKLMAKDTVFRPVDFAVAAKDGTLTCEALRVSTDTLELHGTGSLTLGGTVSTQNMLLIDPDLSAAMIEIVKELQNLTDANGRLEIPVVVQGTLPRVTILPDVQYVASRLVATKAEELLGHFLERALKKQGGNSVPDAPSPVVP